MKQYKNKKNVIKSIVRIVLLVICGLIIGFNVYLANANRLVGNQLPMPFGRGAAVVLSDSMKPNLSTGDLILVKETDSYKKGDVVVFQDGNILVVHRIIGLDGEKITTQGDANGTPDEPIEASAIKGKVTGHIPGVGNIVNFIKTPVGTLLIIAAAVLLIEIPRRSEKKRDDDEKQKIIDEINRLRSENGKENGEENVKQDNAD